MIPRDLEAARVFRPHESGPAQQEWDRVEHALWLHDYLDPMTAMGVSLYCRQYALHVAIREKLAACEQQSVEPPDGLHDLAAAVESSLAWWAGQFYTRALPDGRMNLDELGKHDPLPNDDWGT